MKTPSRRARRLRNKETEEVTTPNLSHTDNLPASGGITSPTVPLDLKLALAESLIGAMIETVVSQGREIVELRTRLLSLAGGMQQ
jgi:hypothetical protein